MQINRIVILILVFLTSIQGFSQKNKVNLTGIVLTQSGQPAEGVSVALKGTRYATLTNEKGEYEIAAEPGNYTLSINFVGYKPKLTKISLEESNKEAPSITIEEDTAALDEVQVVGKTKVQRVKEEAFNITAVDLKQLYNTSADLNQVLNRTTGVRVRETGGMGSQFNFSLNGFSGDQVKFFMDGIPLDNYGPSFTLNNIPTNMAERIDVYKGVVPIELGGDALGGAVNIVTNKSVKRYIDASYSFGSFNTHKAALNTRFTSKNGLVTNFNAFLNYSDNSYKVEAEVPDPFTGLFGPKEELKHFHDGYKQGAIIAEVGVKDKKYADYLLVGIAVSANKKETQQGRTMFRVVGDAFEDSQNFVPSLKYKKTNLFTKDLTATLAASYNIAEERTVDTSSRRFTWRGPRTDVPGYSSSGELNSEKVLNVFKVKSFQSNTNFKYNINENNSLLLNYTHLGYRRKEDNEYTTKDVPKEPVVNKNIIGFSYSLSALQKRLSYTAFVKMLDLQGKIVENPKTINEKVIKPSYNFTGYGTAAAYFLIPEQLQVKASFEHAYRLPAAVELLGDGGINIIPNPYLMPESSDNMNIGLSYKKTFEKHSFAIEGNFLYREAKNFINSVPYQNKSQYQNTKNVQVTGFDGIVHYGYKQWLSLDLNATYQKTLNKDNSVSVGSDQINYLYNKQMPNIPILYGNANLGFSFKHIKYADDLFSVNLLASYSDSYYLRNPKLGETGKKEIPEQLFYSASVAYSLKNGRYNIALECYDITDVNLYDYFNVQKPGRSFTIKLRYFFM
jgi:outer membrane receptor protein involved in Fe transport